MGATTSGQTLHSGLADIFPNHGAPSNTFVFDPGYGQDVVQLLRVGGAHHDTMSFAGADFGNSVAEVLRNTRKAGHGAVITDPTTGDTVRLPSVGKAQLVHDAGDLTFHAWKEGTGRATQRTCRVSSRLGRYDRLENDCAKAGASVAAMLSGSAPVPCRTRDASMPA